MMASMGTWEQAYAATGGNVENALLAYPPALQAAVATIDGRVGVLDVASASHTAGFDPAGTNFSIFRSEVERMNLELATKQEMQAVDAGNALRENVAAAFALDW